MCVCVCVGARARASTCVLLCDLRACLPECVCKYVCVLSIFVYVPVCGDSVGEGFDEVSLFVCLF